MDRQTLLNIIVLTDWSFEGGNVFGGQVLNMSLNDSTTYITSYTKNASTQSRR